MRQTGRWGMAGAGLGRRSHHPGSVTPARVEAGTPARPLSILAGLDRGRYPCIPGENRGAARVGLNSPKNRGLPRLPDRPKG